MGLLEGQMTGTLGRAIISTRQEKLAELARIEPKRVLTTLAHHIDEVWLREAYRRTRKDGAVGIDGVTAAQYEAELEANLASLLERFKSGRYRVLAVLSNRFAKYGLRLHPEKTRLVDFRSPPRRGQDGSQRERSFALREIGHWCRAHRHWPVAAQQAALWRKLQGHYAYYGITGNGRALGRFLFEVRRLWRQWLHRRSWRGRMTWETFARLAARYPLPQPRVVHSIYRRTATP
jgi:hypothetical protein